MAHEIDTNNRMHWLHLLIKGNVEEATRAFIEKTTSTTFKVKLPPDDFTTVVDAYVDLNEVVRWFYAAPYETPYPVGTLLHYSFIDLKD